jgi:hypothetical protein
MVRAAKTLRRNAMKISSAFPSKYLRAADIPDGQFVPVTISHVELEDVSGGDNEGSGEHKPVIYFQGKNKGMVLNKTNAGALSAAFGDDTDDWAGKSVRLFQTETLFQGQMVPCLRIKVSKNKPVQQAKPAAPPAAAKPEYEQLPDQPAADDDIPF